MNQSENKQVNLEKCSDSTDHRDLMYVIYPEKKMLCRSEEKYSMI